MEILYCVHNESNRITFGYYLIAPDFNNVCCTVYRFPECAMAFAEPELDEEWAKTSLTSESF